MTYKEEFITFMVRSGVLTFGDFTTKSGRKTPYFVNTGNYKTGAQAAKLGDYYAACIQEHMPDGITCLFGPAYKGIPLAVSAAASLYRNYDRDLPYCFNRKEAKDHGEGGSMVGYKPQDGDDVAIVEDVVTAGTAVRESIELFKHVADVNMKALFVSVDRMERGTRECSTLDELRQDYGIQVFPIVTVREVIDFLHNPQKYTEIGAKLPKGALLVGPPGTGKTLLAKAVAGEANVPFFSISGSDFVEMFVGMGAARVRDLFKEANKMAPCIVFIDEIDTIGKSRDNRMGGNDEREQTLNQLLAELDGFDPGKGVIVLGATNRPEVLDKALLRPGRFDRRITIDRPNLAGRLATLQVHTRKIKLGEDVDLKKIALATAGTVGADLANLVNEAALRAVRNGRRLVTQEDLLASFEFVIAGSEKKNSVLTQFERKLVAYHEVGHAMVAYKQKNAEPVQKITIVPHTEGSLGYTLLMPEEDKTNLRTKEELMAKITVSMGGRAAEQVVLNTMTNGASQDIQEATNLARNMVAMFGMSDEFGMMALGSIRNQYLDGGYGLDCAQDTAAVMDKAVKAILDQCYQDAVELIRENLEDMHKVVAYLLEKETITGGEMVAIIQGRDPALVEDAYASTHGRSRSLTGDIEPPAKNIHIVSEPVSAPQLPDGEPEQSGPEEPPAQPRDDETPPPQDGEGPNEKPEQDRP